MPPAPLATIPRSRGSLRRARSSRMRTATSSVVGTAVFDTGSASSPSSLGPRSALLSMAWGFMTALQSARERYRRAGADGTGDPPGGGEHLAGGHKTENRRGRKEE